MDPSSLSGTLPGGMTGGFNSLPPMNMDAAAPAASQYATMPRMPTGGFITFLVNACLILLVKI